MPNLFLVDGAAGSGKSALLDYCCTVREDSDFIIKHTTKPKDSDGVERNDLIYSKPDDYDRNPNEYFVYNYPEHSSVRYFISKKQLEDKLKEKRNVFLIVRSVKVIKEIKEFYSKYLNVNIVTLFLYCDKEQLKQRTIQQLKESASDLSEELMQEKVSNRINRNNECLKSYVNSLAIREKIYDYIILNDLDKEEYFNCINNIVHLFEKFDEQFCPPTVFIIMPMPEDREGAHFIKVKEAIAEGAKEAGFDAHRQDDKYVENETIYESIIDGIDNYTVCIADVTKARPNVYFELGRAISNSKKIRNTFIIAQKNETIHFDIEGLKREEYTFTPTDYSQISRIVKEWLQAFAKQHLLQTNKIMKQ